MCYGTALYSLKKHKNKNIVPTEATQKLAKALDANLIILSSGKHFIASDGYTDFPVLLNEIQKLIKD
jgi:hypothetical protein